MSGAMQVPIHFHTVTIAGQTFGQPIDKKCGGFDKINAAKSAGKGAFQADKSGRNDLLTSSESLIFFLLLCSGFR
jgi:hypothetical protein